MERSLRIKLLSAAAVGAGLVGLIAGTGGFLIGRSGSDSSAEQFAYEAGMRVATPRYASVRVVRPEECPPELMVRSFGGNVMLKRREGVKPSQLPDGAYECEYTLEMVYQ